MSVYVREKVRERERVVKILIAEPTAFFQF